MIEKKAILFSYTVMHFLVDLSCIFFLMGMVYTQLPGAQMRLTAAVVYNALAFALPMLLGLLADLTGKNALISCLGCILIVINYLLIPAPWMSVALIGVGNGLFHIGGGRQILQDSGPAHFTPSGVFIASGAFGVFLGRSLAGDFRQAVYQLMWILLSVCVLLLAYMEIRQWKQSSRSRLSGCQIRVSLLLPSLLLFVVVVIRSYYGFAAVYSWNRGLWIAMVFTLSIVAGKFLGGIAADRLGVRAACVISLGGAGLSALFAEASPVIGCVSILLFNMTMPVTLTLLSDLWKHFPGFAFGTLMMALFLGTLPPMIWNVSLFFSPVGQMGLCIVSLGLLLWAIIKMER